MSYGKPVWAHGAKYAFSDFTMLTIFRSPKLASHMSIMNRDSESWDSCAGCTERSHALALCLAHLLIYCVHQVTGRNASESLIIHQSDKDFLIPFHALKEKIL